MKRNLLNTLSLTAILGGIFSPLATEAQCLCEGGVAPNVLKYTYVLDTTSMSSSDITFPKFNPAMGVLNCVRFEDTLSLISTSNVNNTSPQPETYIFNLRVVNNFAGPGMNVAEVAQRTYGPTPLAAFGQPGYQTTYGPDTLFTNSKHSTNSSNVTGYMSGAGPVVFRYTVNGGLTSDLGGINYNYQIISKYWGRFGLTYFWCPNAVLSSNIKNFTAVKSNKNVNLTWIVGNNLISNTYEIQVSKNGREFFGAGSAQTSSSSSGTTAKYAYQYNPNQAVAGQLYFRVKQTDVNGKISYSTVKALNMDHQAASSFTAYPNPVVNKVSLQFDANLDGDFNLDVTNQVGQTVISRPLRLKNTSLIDLNLSKVNAPGMYYVRVKDAVTGQVFTNKIMINR
ncbi:MAG: T9SS type A sorting domain-containing protein [Pedobacter sp.]|nr:MAG: T9SS type A sorting domain-containing protein [Pedobacter sp.]